MLIFSHPSARTHDPTAHLAEHPDTPERIVAVEAALEASGWFGAERRLAPPAGDAELALVHTPELIARIGALAAGGGGAVDAETFVGEGSLVAARHGAGGALALTRALIAGEDTAGFCLTRPAGHHAEAGRAMGFCLFNHVALAAELAIRELGAERVLIIDWDVHHGNGTAEIFRHRADVLYASIHQERLFPGTGAAADTGSGDGRGYTVNLPVPAGSDGEVWLSMLEHLILPIGLTFSPSLILVSAGFDAHRLDPLADCRLEAADFAQLAAHVHDLALDLAVPVGAVLEGGYHPAALAESVQAAIAGLDGTVAAESIAPDAIFTPRAAARLGHLWDL